MSTTPHDGRPVPDADEARRVAGLGPALESLRGLPPVPPGAVDRVVAAAVARGHRPGGARREVGPLARVVGGSTWRVAAGLLLVVGAGALWTSRGNLVEGPTARVAAAPAAAPVAARSEVPTALVAPVDLQDDLVPVAAAAEPDAPLPVAFLLSRPGAGRVTLVGDFNGWDPKATPLVRNADGTWTTTVALAPGRHAYAFVVDDSAWVTDPRTPVTRDADYGRDHSMVVVGAP